MRRQSARIVLPVSRLAVALRQPTGAEDVLLAEPGGDQPVLALHLVERLARAETPVDWAVLSVTDIDTLIMRLRQGALGDIVSSSLTCSAPGCAAKVEISFGIDTYLTHHAPRHGVLKRRGWTVSAPDEQGYYRLTGDHETVTFRLPALRDQMAVAGEAEPERALAARCIAPADLPAKILARVQAAMTVLAPPLHGTLQGGCPDCGAVLQARFEARSYCLRELSLRAKYVFDDIDVLAGRYHWSERAILALPRVRREHYAERARAAA